MAKLAIRGHATRGEEVIEILEMFGGENGYKLRGANEECAYYEKNGRIHNTAPVGCYNFKLFTLEEFLEHFPYKIGDKVKNARINDFVGRIINARWDNNEEQVIYTVEFDDVTKSTLTYFAKGLQPYKEMIAIKENSFENLQTEGVLVKAEKTITTEEFNHNSKEWIIDRLACMSADDALQTICDLHDELHKPIFPKTYEECLKILGYNVGHTIPMNHGHKGLLIMELQRLLIFRDAYWKLVGDWKPDWEDKTDKYVIANYNNHIVLDVRWHSSTKLSFPNKEIRGAFYENFKELIEECKELL